MGAGSSTRKASSDTRKASMRRTDTAVARDMARISTARDEELHCTAHASLTEKYELLEKLGEGGYGVVKRGRPKMPADDEGAADDVAVKLITKTEGLSLDDLMSEIDIMKAAGVHQNIVAVRDIFESPERVVIVMDLVSGGELIDRLVKRNFTEHEAARAMRSLCCGLAHLHALNIAHRDVKPENILYTSTAEDAELKLADFGISKVFYRNTPNMDRAHTPLYVTPEVLLNKGYNSGAIDMWPAGCVLHLLLSGTLPFLEGDGSREARRAMYKSILKANLDFSGPAWSEVSEEAIRLIRGLIVVEPSERLKAAEVIELVDNWLHFASRNHLKAAVDTLRLFSSSRKNLGLSRAASVAFNAPPQAAAESPATDTAPSASPGNQRLGHRESIKGIEACLGSTCEA